MRDHLSKAQRAWTQVKDKWDKLKRHYHKEKKLHNVTSDNVSSQWIWFNMIDKVHLGTTKINKEPGGMDNDQDVGVEEQPPN